MKSSSTHKGIKDYRRLKYCPSCGGWSVTHPGERHPLTVCTHRFSNWDEVQAREAERKKIWIPKPPPSIPLQTATMQCLCALCGWSAYFLADTGKRCDRLGRKMRKTRGRKKG